MFETVVTIEQLDTSRTAPALGQACVFAARGKLLSKVDYFLEHEGVFYPEPLPVGTDGSVRVFPEAPGRYRLHAAWRSARGEDGWAQTEFHVPGPNGSEPQRIRADGETLWVPTSWDGQTLGAHERPVFKELRKVIRSGATVYDIGANVGVFATRFLRWIGAKGWLYAIEPNPVCVYFLRANLGHVGANNFTILPVAASSRSGECLFRLNYGSSMLGVGADSASAGKPGHQIRVGMESLDALVATLNLRKPDFIKLDVEGAEASAVTGMMETLKKSRPSFMFELHGHKAAAETLRCLTGLGYNYLVCSTAERYQTAETLLDSLPNACVQVIGCP